MDIKNTHIHSPESPAPHDQNQHDLEQYDLGQYDLSQEFFAQKDPDQHAFAPENQDQQPVSEISLAQDSVDTDSMSTAPTEPASEDQENTGISPITERPTDPVTDQLTDNNVDKIRDILFGGNMRDYDKRFARLEDRLIADVERLSQDVFKRFENLDTFMRTEFESISHKLNLEKRERDDNLNELKTVQKRTDERISDVEQQHSAEARTLRISLHEQGNELLDMIRATHDELATLISKEARELQDVKVARSDLAELFSEFALRLNRDFNLPKLPE